MESQCFRRASMRISPNRFKPRLITTFATHQGLCCYKGVMFGIFSPDPPEAYQPPLELTFSSFSGCPNVRNISDDTMFKEKTKLSVTRNPSTFCSEL